MQFPDHFDVIVVGGGHAGTEAAAAAARVGAHTLLLTQNIETIGQMSCNPAIGGIGKSHLVAEIDAMDGLMARAADQAGIHFKVLNASKGPAVRATRAQADRALYKNAVRGMLEQQQNLQIFQQSVVDFVLRGDRVCGVVTQMGLTFTCDAIVLTTGTFLGGKIHIGTDNHAGGRAGDAPSIALADRLRSLPFRVGRLKTGTPPRLDRRSINYQGLAEQPGDEPRPTMSALSQPADHPAQVLCHIARTNPATHEIIASNIHRSAMYSGAIEGTGPRYCPSIEDKVVRFADKLEHQIFLEPEGLHTTEVYPNGISTSLPFDVQLSFVRSIKGFEQAHITRPGYAIEYDYFDPRDLQYSLQTKVIEGLYFAGQINGTTGYEEAGAQGLLAGINAARQVQGLSPWEPRRNEAYLGVLVDDLITLGTAEPYRMFTSRAEFRLRLRQDNAHQRLTQKGVELAVVGAPRAQWFSKFNQRIEALTNALRDVRVSPGDALDQGLKLGLKTDTNLLELLKRPEISGQQLLAQATSGNAGFSDHLLQQLADRQILSQVETDTKYAGYIKRQDEEIARIRRHEGMALPADLDYQSISGLSNELRQKLTEQQPLSLARAARIPGMTPAALSLLLVVAKQQRSTAAAQAPTREDQPQHAVAPSR